MQDWVDGLDARLEANGGYFHGKEPTMADTVAYAFLANSLGQSSTNKEFVEMVLTKPRLRKYAAELTKRWFPEYEGVLKLVEG